MKVKSARVKFNYRFQVRKNTTDAEGNVIPGTDWTGWVLFDRELQDIDSPQSEKRKDWSLETLVGLARKSENDANLLPEKWLDIEVANFQVLPTYKPRPERAPFQQAPEPSADIQPKPATEAVAYRPGPGGVIEQQPSPDAIGMELGDVQSPPAASPRSARRKS